MFSLDGTLRYWLYSEPTDMRKSFHTLSGIVNNGMESDVRNGDVYIFVNKRRNRIKLLRYEPGGMVIYSKMLDRGTLTMPSQVSSGTPASSVTWDELRRMAEGVMSDPGSRAARIRTLENLWKY